MNETDLIERLRTANTRKALVAVQSDCVAFIDAALRFAEAGEISVDVLRRASEVAETLTRLSREAARRIDAMN